MTPFQKLFWLYQMGVSCFCGESVRRIDIKQRSSDTNSLDTLNQKIEKIQNSLSKTALHPMTGSGCTTPKVMCVLEAPSAQEDKTGQYLAGPEGELTKKMLSAIGLDIQKNTYLTYLSPWRAPGNRPLTNAEVNQCRPFLEKRIDLIKPQFLLLFGTPVIRALLENKTLSQARLGHEKYSDIIAFGTFAPGWLIKNPDYRRPAWEDLKKFKKMIDA